MGTQAVVRREKRNGPGGSGERRRGEKEDG